MSVLLFLGASPAGLPALDYAYELRKLRAGLRDSPCSNEVRVEPELGVSANDFTRHVITYKPLLLHLAFHGDVDGIYFRSELDGTAQIVPTEAWQALAQACSSTVKVMTMSSCCSAEIAKELSSNIDFVIAMNDEISDEAAADFASTFYTSLFAGFTVQESFEYGKAQVAALNNMEGDIPQLLSRKNDASQTRIFDRPQSFADKTDSGLTLICLPQVNYVRFGDEKYTENAQFWFSAGFNIVNGDTVSILTGFEALYMAPDACYCANRDVEMSIAGKNVESTDNYSSLRHPLTIHAHQALQISLSRRVRPPLQVQCPGDCDLGFLHVLYRYCLNSQEIEVNRFFKFEVDGNLSPISEPPEPPVLSNSILNKMLSEGRISETEFDRANLVDPIERYRIVRFPAGFVGSRRLDIPHFRQFLLELNTRCGE